MLAAPLARSISKPTTGPLVVSGNQQIARLLTFGDSISGYYAPNSAPYSALYLAGYQCTIRQLCQCRYAEIPTSDGRPCWSHSGKSAAQMVSEGSAAAAVAAMTRPRDLAFIHAGTNDLAQSYTGAQTASNVIALWDVFRAAGKRYAAAEILPHSDGTWAAEKAIANALIKAEAHARGIRFVEWGSALTSMTDDFNAPDKVHPSILGHVKMGHAAFPVLSSLFAPYAPRTGFASANPSLAGANAGNSWVPTGFTIAGSATRSAQQYVAASDGGGDWLEYTVTTAGTRAGIQLATPTVAAFPATHYRASGEIEVEMVSGRVTIQEFHGCYLRENALSRIFDDGSVSSEETTKWDTSTWAMPSHTIRTETPWVPKNSSATWTSLTAYFRAFLGPNSEAKIRFRNLGILPY